MTILLSEQTQEYFAYLDSLRSSGVTNMFGAGRFLQREFGMEAEEARTVLGDWMQCFSARHGDSKETVDLDAATSNIPRIMIDRLGTEVQPTKDA